VNRSPRGHVCSLSHRPRQAQSGDPIKIGVIAEVQSIAGAATPGGAQIAAEEINAKGGVLGRKIEIVSYDNKGLVGGFRARLPAGRQ
jgi:ABC-type branched-subunit amino acid transport system substrate-binding protein